MNDENKAYLIIGAVYVGALIWGAYNTYLMGQVVKTNKAILAKG